MLESPTAPFPLQTQDTASTREVSTLGQTSGTRQGPPPPFSTPSYLAASSAPRLLIATGGQYVRIRRPRSGPPERREWKRGQITHFTARSRSRMLQSVAQIDQRKSSPDVLFVTLTYPKWYPTSMRICKGHLWGFLKRVSRAHPDAWCYWKLEYQVRGAPHFHLMIFNAGTSIEEWWHDAWFDVVKSGEHFHWFYGTDVRRVHSWKEVTGYCAKYTAKETTQQVCDSPGRFWGVANKKNRPATVIEAPITDGEFYAIRRMLRRYIGARQGYHAPGGRDSGVWARMSEGGAKRLAGWAADLYHPARGMMLSPPDDLAYGPGRQLHGNDFRSTDGWDAAPPSMLDGTIGTSRLPLYSRADVQRARALARAS